MLGLAYPKNSFNIKWRIHSVTCCLTFLISSNRCFGRGRFKGRFRFRASSNLEASDKAHHFRFRFEFRLHFRFCFRVRFRIHYRFRFQDRGSNQFQERSDHSLGGYSLGSEPMAKGSWKARTRPVRFSNRPPRGIYSAVLGPIAHIGNERVRK